jgi:hypothetical protein
MFTNTSEITNPKGRDNLKDLGADGRIIINA